MAAKITNETEKKPETVLLTNISDVQAEESKEGSKLKEQNSSSFAEISTRDSESGSVFSQLKDGMKLGQRTSKFNRVFSLIQDNSITLRNLVVAASTYGLERLLNAKVFHCPENGYRQYGFAFLFGPVLVLFCANLLVIGEIWKLSSRMYVKRYKRRGDCIARVLPSLLKACVGPAVWLIVAFLEEDYYLCAKVGPFPRKEKEQDEEEAIEKRRMVEECESQSHVLAWVILVTLVALGTALIVWKHCYLKDNLLMENLYSYERREALSAMRAFTERMGGSSKDADLDNDPNTAEYGRKEEKVTIYSDGVPETIGRKTVEKLFEDYKAEQWKDGDKWHYIKVYKTFKEMYPRISTGSPLDPWRVVRGDVHDTRAQETCRLNCLPTCMEKKSSQSGLEPLSIDGIETGDARESHV